MSAPTKGGMTQSTMTSPEPTQKNVCFHSEDGAWYSVGAVVCNNGHDWECKPNGRWTARGSSDSCKI